MENNRPLRRLDLEELRKQKTYVAIVLDRSTSMDTIQKEIIDAVHDNIRTIALETGEMKSSISVVTFSTTVDQPIFWNEDPKLVAKRRIPYFPSGLTAMYDAVGYTVEKLLKMPDAGDKNVAFLIMVVSDGFENNSKGYDSKKLAELIKKCNDTGRWTFTYLGANQDLSKVSDDTNILLSNTAMFQATPQGTMTAASMSSSSLQSYYSSRSAGITQSRNFYDNNNQEEGTTNAP